MASRKAAGRNHTTITIPKLLYNRLESMIQGTGFVSVSSYVTFVMRELVADKLVKAGSARRSEEEYRVKKRLRSLGYI
jgi:hypothetical protein